MDERSGSDPVLARDLQRLWDLVRYQRGELFTAGLITDEDFAALVEDHPAVARLETYDGLRKERDELLRRCDKYENEMAEVCPEDYSLKETFSALQKERERLRAEIERLRADKERLDWLESEIPATLLTHGTMREAIDQVMRAHGRVPQSTPEAKHNG